MNFNKIAIGAIVLALCYVSTSSAQLFRRARCCQPRPCMQSCYQPVTSCCGGTMMGTSTIVNAPTMGTPMVSGTPVYQSVVPAMSGNCGCGGMVVQGSPMMGGSIIGNTVVDSEGREIGEGGVVYNENCDQTYQTCLSQCVSNCNNSVDCQNYCLCNKTKCLARNPNAACNPNPPKPACLPAQPNPVPSPGPGPGL